MSQTNVDFRLRAAAFAAARLGMALDAAWCDELRGRSIPDCVIPSARPVRATRPETAATSPASIAKDDDVDDEIAEKLLAFLAERLGPSDLDRAEGILQGRDDGPTGMAADSLRRRVAAGVTRRQAARGGSFEAMFPHANRLA